MALFTHLMMVGQAVDMSDNLLRSNNVKSSQQGTTAARRAENRFAAECGT